MFNLRSRRASRPGPGGSSLSAGRRADVRALLANPRLPPVASPEPAQYDNTTLLARQFEGELQSHGLLDTRSAAELDEDAAESLTTVLSGFYRSSVSGLAQTAGSVYSGARELAADVGRDKETKGWWGAIKDRAGSIGGTPLSPYREAGKGKEREEFLDVSLDEAKCVPLSPPRVCPRLPLPASSRPPS